MQVRSPVSIVLAAAAVALLVVLVAQLLQSDEILEDVRTGEIPSRTPEGPGSSTASSLAGGKRRVQLSNGDADREQEDRHARADVVGIVRDSLGSPLQGVRVDAHLRGGARSDPAPIGATTNARGEFSVPLHAGDLADLAFCCTGFRPSQRSVRAPCTGLAVVLERSPTLSGRVEDPDGTPVAGALVRWSSVSLARDAGESITTRADGRFAFGNVPWGLDLEVRAPGALPEYRSVRVVWGMPELVITVDSGRETTGRIVDAESGAGLSDASVELWYYRSTYTAEGRRGGASQRAETAKAGADGSFTLTRLPSTARGKRPEAYLWVTAPGRAPHWKLIPHPERVDGIQVALYPAGSVCGRVVDARGTPVVGQRVHAEAEVQGLCDAGSNRNYRGQEAAFYISWSKRRPRVVAPFQAEREAFTDSKGGYIIDGIPCPKGGGEVTIAVPAGTPETTVVARAGEVVDAGDLVVADGLYRPWHGVVQDEVQRPVSGARIELSIVRTHSDDRGHFDLEVPAGTQGNLVLRAGAPGYVPIRRVLVPTSGSFCECDEDGLTVTLTRCRALAVQVIDKNHRPVPNALVRIFPDGALEGFEKSGRLPSWLESGRSDDRGTASMERVPASCDVLVQYPRSYKPTHSRILKSVSVGSGTLRVILEDLDILRGTAAISMVFIDGRKGRPFDGFVLIDGASEKIHRHWMAQGADIRLEGLPLGRWDLCVSAEGLGIRTARVDLRQDQRIEVRLGEGADILGQVTCSESPLSGAVQVQVLDLATKRVTVTPTDSTGRFSFAGVKPGRYEVSVEPFENLAFSRLGVRNPQRYASGTPIRLQVEVGVAPAFITLPVVPVAPLRVIVKPSTASHAFSSLWSWAQDLRFTVTDPQGVSVYQGRASDFMAAGAELMLCLRKRRYKVTVHRNGVVLGKRRLDAGETWQLDTK